MQAILHSAFLQALGYAIANSLWQAALLWMLSQLICSVGRPSAPRKYYVAVVAQLAGFTWFLFTLQFYYGYCSDLMAAAGNTLQTGSPAYYLEPEITGFSSAILYGMIRGEQLLPYLSAAYLCMLLFLAVRLGRAWHYTHRIRHQGLQKAGIDTRLFVQRTAGYLGIKQPVRIYLSHLVTGPLTIGFLKPLILLPVASVTHLTPTQLEALLLHELAHIKRADFVINIVQSVIETLLFFNPFIQLLGKQIRKERENSCDDWVLQFQYQPAVYAEALLRIATLQAQPRFAMQATGATGELLPRVKRMLNKQDRPAGYRTQVIAFLLITVLLVTVAWMNPGMDPARLNRNQPTAARTVTVEPLSANISNPVFNPLYFLARPMSEERREKNIATIDQPVAAPKPGSDEHSATPPPAPEVITPLALESLSRMMEEAGAAIEITAAKTGLQQATAERIVADMQRHINDSLQRINALVQEQVANELRRVEWDKIRVELEKASVSMQQELQQNKVLQFFPGLQQLGGAMEKAEAELRRLEAEQQLPRKKAELSPARITEAQRKAELVAESREKLNTTLRHNMTEQFKARMPGVSRRISPPVTVAATNPGAATNFEQLVIPEGDGYSFNLDALYTPALFMDEDYTYSYADAANGIDSALIIVAHDPANEKSHIKNITIQVTGSNGKTKTYSFSVKLYQ